jgi:biotin carboxyl carrier protein
MKLKITVHGVAYEVEVEVLDPGEGFAPRGSLPAPPGAARAPRPSSAGPAAPPPPAPSGPAPAAAPSADAGAVASPIAGTVVEVKVKPGDSVTQGQTLLVVETMKMNTSIAAPSAGKIKAIPVAAGDSVREGQVLVELE